MPSEFIVVEDTMRIKKRLEEAIVDKPVASILDQLKALENINMNLDVLSKTLIGKVVAQLRAHDHAEVSKLANALVKKWAVLAQSAKASPSPAAKAAAVKPVTPKPTPAPAPATASRLQPKDIITQMLMKVIKDTVGFLSTEEAAALANAASKSAEGAGVPGDEDGEAPKLSDAASPTAAESGNLSSLLCKQTEEEVKKQAEQAALAIHEALTEATKHEPKPATAYGEQFRTISLNLPNNPSLALNVYNGVIPANELVKMKSDQMISDDSKKKMEEMHSKYRESVMLDWKTKNRARILASAGIDASSSLLVCKNCKSKNTEFSERQTRSADEPTTKFAFCHDCGNRWKFC